LVYFASLYRAEKRILDKKVTLWCLTPLFHGVVKKNELKLNEAEYKIIEEIIMARKEKKLT